MINSIATYKESLSRIANEVLDAADELEIHPPIADSPASGRRIPHRSPIFRSPAESPVANGTDSPFEDEITKYKSDIEKLKASEAEIKALSFNYAAILKEKEKQLSKLREENGSLRKFVDANEVVGLAASGESPKSLSNSSNAKGNIDRLPIRSQRNTTQGRNSRSGNHLLKSSTPKQDGFSNGHLHVVPFDAVEQNMEPKFANLQGNEKEYGNLIEEIRLLELAQVSHESEIKQLKALLDNEHENASTVKLKLQEERVLNETSQKELQDLKIEKEKAFGEMKLLQKEINEKTSEMRRLQVELSRRDVEEEPNGVLNNLDNLRNTISALEKENAKLKIEKNELEASLKLYSKTTPEKVANEDMAVSHQKLEEKLHETCKERDKALHELARLKQHLLDKLN